MKWNKERALAMVTRAGCEIVDHTIQVKRAGIKVWGAINYLCDRCGYKWTR